MRRFVHDYIRVLYAHNDGPQAVRDFVRKCVAICFIQIMKLVSYKFDDLHLIAAPTAKEAPAPILESYPIWWPFVWPPFSAFTSIDADVSAIHPTGSISKPIIPSITMKTK